jgi:GT2 family glycosyltransferase
MIIRREALNEVGLLDEDYFMYTEEVDLLYRLKQKNWSVHWLPSAEIMHYGGQSTQQVSREMFLQLYQTKILFFRKNYGALKANGYKLILLIASLFRLASSPFTAAKPTGNRETKNELAHNYRNLVKVLLGF